MPRNLLIVGLVLALTLGVFIRTAGHDFIIWDDNKNIFENPGISPTTLKGIPQFWTRSYHGLYIPVTYTAWALLAYNSETNGQSGIAPALGARNFHLGNLLLHLGSVALVILLFYQLLGRKSLFAAAVGAAFFAFHPLQVEPVAWATGLKDVLSTFLGLVSILLYLTFSRSFGSAKPARTWTVFTLALLVFHLALLAKPQLVIIPPIMAIFDLLIQHAPWKRVTFSLIPFFLAAFSVVGITIFSHPEQDAIFPFAHPSLLQRPLIALDALGFYISKFFYPFRLGIDYGRTPERALALALKYPLWLAPLIVFALILRIKRNHRYYFTGFAVALVAVLPVLGFIPFAFQGQSTVADRYVYFAMIGVGFAVASFLTFTEKSLPKYAFACLLPLMAFVAFTHVGRWKNSITLLTHATSVNPLSVASHYNIGLAYSKTNEFDAAHEWFKKTLDLKEDFSWPYNNIGYVLNAQGRYKEAIPYLEKAIALDPDQPSAYINLGIAYDRTGRDLDAVAQYDKALQLNPRDAGVFVNLGMVHTDLEQWQRALDDYNQAAFLDKSLHQPYSGMGRIHMRLKDHRKAADAYQNAVNLQPDDPLLWREFAEALARSGQFERAVDAVTKALATADTHPVAPHVRQLMLRQLESHKQGRPSNSSPSQPPSVPKPLPPTPGPNPSPPPKSP